MRPGLHWLAYVALALALALGSPLSFGPSDIKTAVSWQADVPTVITRGEEQVDQISTFNWRESG